VYFVNTSLIFSNELNNRTLPKFTILIIVQIINYLAIYKLQLWQSLTNYYFVVNWNNYQPRRTQS